MSRTSKALMIYALAAAAVAAAWLWRLGDQTGGQPLVTEQGAALVGGPFALTDQDGNLRTDGDFRGRHMLVFFGFTHCPDICPTTLAVIADALEKLGPKAANITPLFITTDPARDTPAIVAQYVKSFGPQFVGLTGDEKSVEAAMKAYRVYAKKRDLPGGGYSVDHSSVIYLMGRDGKYVRHFDDAISPDELARELEKNL